MPWPRLTGWISGIQGQLVLGLLSVVLLITLLDTLASTWLHRRFFAEALDGEARARIGQLATTTAAVLADDDGNAPALAAILTPAADDPAVRGIGLFGPDGEPLFFRSSIPNRSLTAAPPAEARTDVVRHAVVAPNGEDLWVYHAPVRRTGAAPAAPGAPLGVLQVEVSLAPLDDALDRSVWLHALMLLVIVPAGVALSLLCARRIAAPVRALANHAEAVSISIASAPVPATGAREIQALAGAINHMLRTLRSSMARLRQSEARYRGLFDRMPDVALELDAEGRVLAVNEAVGQLGVRPAELVGQSLGRLVAESDVPLALSAVKQALETRTLTTTAVRLRCPAPELRFGELRAALHQDGGAPADGGQNAGPRLVAILRDVTESRRASDEVAHAQRVLSIHTLASGISHEFNNVMAMIIGTGSLLTTRPDLPAEVEREVKRIVETARRGAALSSQVLSYARRTGEQQAAADLDAVIRDTMDLLSRTLDKRIEILVRSPSALPRVKGDPTRLQQVLLNLGINAGEAMPGGGTLAIEAKPLTIHRKVDADRWGVERGSYVQIEVRDTGHGMDEAVLRRVFEPYYTTKQPGAGTGLGLAVVYGAVRGLGGGIYVDSHPNEGAAFHLLLPVAGPPAARGQEGAAAPRRRPSRDRLAPVSGRTLLVVEDEPDLRELARRVLERRGYTIFEAADGFEAEAVLREHAAEIDLVLLDVNLPRRDGAATYDVLRELRPTLPVVIVSAGGVTDQRIADLLRRGALTLVRKPYEFEELEDVVARALTGPGEDSARAAGT
jgi:PAS domain S-box-containing protein